MKYSNPDQNPAHRSTTEPQGLTSSHKHGSTLLILLPFLAFFTVSASAQSATNFNTKKIAPTPAAEKTVVAKKESSPAHSDTALVKIGPSRYVGEADLAIYVETIASAFSMKSRETDPFGQFQDPNSKPIIKASIASPTRRATPTLITPFADIIRLIQVTTIMPGEQSFLIGTRSFKRGDRFPINFRGRTTNVEIASVTSRKIQFRNVETNESAALELKLLPVGMTPGNGQITAPGMVPDRPNSPLEIEPNHSLNDTSQN